MSIHLSGQHLTDLSFSATREWLLTNGTGAYAMGTVAGLNTRRYHGHLVAVRPGTLDRYVLLDNVEAFAIVDGEQIGLSSNQYVGAVHPDGYSRIVSFSSGNVIEWRRSIGDIVVVKQLSLSAGDSANVTYWAEGGEVDLLLRPLVCHKHYHGNFRVAPDYPQSLVASRDATTIGGPYFQLRLFHIGADVSYSDGWYYRFERTRELERGLDPYDDLFCPLELRYRIGGPMRATLVASAHTVEVAAGGPTTTVESADTSVLHDAAAHFVVRVGDRSTVIAGYPWFTDWGRDTMISLPGLLLRRGEVHMARRVLWSYARYVKAGLIPNRLPEIHVEGQELPEGYYNTADATLWFVNAVYLTHMAEPAAELGTEMLPVLQEIVDAHVFGTLYGIGVDPEDGLLRQGCEGVQLTWMDAKVGDWVVTPRSGKAVEINGLWINALRILQELGGEANGILATASFNEKFFSGELGYFFDVCEPYDASLRPNQLIAMSLPFSPVHPEHARLALARITDELLTPVGIRTLSPNDPSYCGRFEGAMHERDAAYHQGTVWPWLLGPYVNAVAKFAPDMLPHVRSTVDVERMVGEYGLGGIAEVYDGDTPHRPGGCPWQAWSVAEVLRVKSLLEL